MNSPATISHVRRLVPRSVIRLRTTMRDRMALRQTPAASCDVAMLGPVSHLNLAQVLAESDERTEEWRLLERRLADLKLSETAGGVNPGDRRALYSLIRTLRPHSVLEVGTHVGASTASIASALRRLATTELPAPYHLTTVDITDVNDPVEKPWQRFGSSCSPAELIEQLGCRDHVTFIAQPSLNHLAQPGEGYDLIFLDGDHAARTVYREIPAALRRLRRGGYLILHDYFPQLKPLWSNGMVSPGPYLAVRRLRAEGVPIRVLPLGRLPWPTKLGSFMTSLAVLGRA